MNSVSLTGRATSDLDLRYTQAGKEVASGTIAVQRNFKNNNGDYEADFISFVAWGKTGLLMAEHIKKGEHFGITGRLQTRNYENQQGQKIYVTEVVVSDFDFPVRPKGQGNNQTSNQSNTQSNNDPFSGGQPLDISDSDLPF